LCDKGRRPLFGDGKYGDALPDVAKAMLDYTHKELPTGELRAALGELAALTPDAYADRVGKLIEGLAKVHSIPFRQALIDYLAGWPASVRQALRRPSDPAGKSAPDALQFYKPDDLLLFLPPRPPRFKCKARPANLDGWELAELRGLGECSEVWLGRHENQREAAGVCLKFATDLETADRVLAQKDLFVKAFELNDTAGVVPLRAVYLESDPPCLEYAYVSGYDLTALMYDWKWRFDAPKPEAALKLMRRLTDIVAKVHKAGLVHRDLKPSNVLLHPTEGGKFTLWVTDLGWGQIEAIRSIELSRTGTPRGEQHRLSLRGAHTPLYASPQLTKKEPPDPRDDVHALGVIWYQLLKRDPHAAAPVGNEWVEEFRPAGFTDSQAKLLNACLATRPEKRPNDAGSLGEMLANVAVATASAQEGSAVIQLKTGSSEHAMVPGGPKSGRFLRDSPGSKSGVMAPVSAAGQGGLPRLVSNSIGMTFALIPSGKFTMGSNEAEPGRREHEGPEHEVTITQPFYLGILPVTQGQYDRVTGRHPAHFSKHHGGGPDYPVETVSWHDAEAFCQKLSLLADEEIHGRAYRLPTEAEWEYACRAGTVTPFSCGEKLTPKDAHYASAGAFAKTGGTGKTSPAGSLPANPWGLHDMHGNVQEWVQDWYDEYYYFDSPKDDPQGPAKGNLKVTRGGCWVMFANDCRSAARRPHAPDSPSNAIGFRVVLVSGKG
jgi:formylglycine-generating enzyme required for sulfatase activity